MTLVHGFWLFQKNNDGLNVNESVASASNNLLHQLLSATFDTSAAETNALHTRAWSRTDPDPEHHVSETEREAAEDQRGTPATSDRHPPTESLAPVADTPRCWCGYDGLSLNSSPCLPVAEGLPAGQAMLH